MQAVWETGIPVWMLKLWCPKKQFSTFLFLYFNQKYVEVAINDSQCIFLFRNGLEDNARQKRKTMRQYEVEAKEDIV